jgi:hypothetical protein
MASAEAFIGAYAHIRSGQGLAAGPPSLDFGVGALSDEFNIN